MSNTTNKVPIVAAEMCPDKYRMLNIKMWAYTLNHIRRVQINGLVLMRIIPELHTKNFKSALFRHDITKFNNENEREYTYLIDQFVNKTVYSFDDNADMKNAWMRHQREEKHHPEYWMSRKNGLFGMPEVHLAEMVSNWHAKTQELRTMHTRKWFQDLTTADGIQKAEYEFSPSQTLFIERCIDVLEKYAPVVLIDM